ncbi:hypothetical protein [Oxynema sp. CENA135]|nr:hypothetical protein [Oxynema sp. CENA135]
MAIAKPLPQSGKPGSDRSAPHPLHPLERKALGESAIADPD